MLAPCGGDALDCIEFAVLAIGEFLRDWTTLAMLSILLVLLFRLKGERQRAREAAYAGKLAAYDDKRSHETPL